MSAFREDEELEEEVEPGTVLAPQKGAVYRTGRRIVAGVRLHPRQAAA